jgi:hypothetical protein
MLTFRFRAVAISGAIVLLTIIATPSMASATGDGDPDHACAVDPNSAACQQWLASNPPVNDSSDPVCFHLGAYVPCQSPERFRGQTGWWVGDVVLGRGWSYVRRGDPSRIDDPAAGSDHTHGCWGWLAERTGGTTGVDSPGSDPDVEGAWYRLLCLGRQQYSETIDITQLPGFHEEVTAWRETSSGPVGDPVQAALNAFASLDLGTPTIVTSPPSFGSVPLGMPVWLAVDNTAAAMGPLSATGCDQSLCVTIETWVHTLEWHLGNGDSRTCPATRNRLWQPGMEFLDPAAHDACHYYYRTPSRHQGGSYDIEVTAHWHTYWEAASIGQSGGPLEHSQPPASTTATVVEIQVLVGAS